MADKTLTIRLNVDANTAKGTAHQLIAELGKAEAATKKLGDSQEKEAKRGADATAREARRGSVGARDALGRIVAASKEAADAQVQHARTAAEGTSKVAGALMGIGAQYYGLNQLAQVVAAIGQGFQKARTDIRRFADELNAAQEELIALASIQGQKVDNKFVLENADYQAATAMRSAEATRYQEAFYGSGAQNIGDGKSFSKKEGAEFNRLSASLTKSTGISEDVMGKLAGSMGGYKNYSKHGDQAAETALGDLYSVVKILQFGKGENPVLARQTEMIASAILNEDTLKGLVQDPRDVATLASTGAEFHDASAAEHAKGAIRALRKLKPEVAKRAGIDANTPIVESMKKFAALAQTEGMDKGIKLQDYIDKHVETALDREGLNVFINRGVFGGVIDSRTAEGAKYGTGDAMRDIKDYQTNPDGPGLRAIREAEERKSRLMRGIPESRLDPLRLEAEAKLRRGQEIDTSTTNAYDSLKDKLNFSGVAQGSRDQRIVAEQMEILKRRGQAVGVEPFFPPGVTGMAAEGQQYYLGQAASQIQGAGGDPYHDTGELKDAIRENTQALRAITPAKTVPLAAAPRGNQPTQAR